MGTSHLIAMKGSGTLIPLFLCFLSVSGNPIPESPEVLASGEKEPYYEKTTTTTYKPTEYETTTTYKPKEYESTTTYKPKEYTTTTTYKPTEYETKPPTKYEKPAYTTKKYVYTTPKYYEGQTIKSEYEKPESFKKHIPEGIDAPKPKPYYETEKPYVPLELTTPNVSYYLPNYKPVNPEIPVVHGIPNAPKPKYEVKEIPYERKTSLYTTYYTTTTTTTTTTYTTTTEKYPETQYHVEVKPEYKEVNYDKLKNPEHDKIPEKPSTYATEKYEEPKYKPKSYVPDHESSEVKVPKYVVKKHEDTPYEAPKYEKSPWNHQRCLKNMKFQSMKSHQDTKKKDINLLQSTRKKNINPRKRNINLLQNTKKKNINLLHNPKKKNTRYLNTKKRLNQLRKNLISKS